MDYTKKSQVVTLSSKSKAKVEGDPIYVDPQPLFQQCTTAANGMFEDHSESFKYELTIVSSFFFITKMVYQESQTNQHL